MRAEAAQNFDTGGADSRYNEQRYRSQPEGGADVVPCAVLPRHGGAADADDQPRPIRRVGPNGCYLMWGGERVPRSVLHAVPCVLETLDFNNHSRQGFRSGDACTGSVERDTEWEEQEERGEEEQRQWQGHGHGAAWQRHCFPLGGAGVVEGIYLWLRFETLPPRRSISGNAAAAAGGAATVVDCFDTLTSWPLLFLPATKPLRFEAAPSSASGKAGMVLNVRTAVRGTAGLTPTYSFVCEQLGMGQLLPRGCPNNSPGGSAASHDWCGAQQLGLPELYPLTGGAWCRACGGLSRDDDELWTSFAECAGCGACWHRACLRRAAWCGEVLEPACARPSLLVAPAAHRMMRGSRACRWRCRLCCGGVSDTRCGVFVDAGDTGKRKRGVVAEVAAVEAEKRWRGGGGGGGGGGGELA